MTHPHNRDVAICQQCQKTVNPIRKRHACDTVTTVLQFKMADSIPMKTNCSTVTTAAGDSEEMGTTALLAIMLWERVCMGMGGCVNTGAFIIF